ncbi:MAG: hypothetical protein LAT82_01395 [Nanoarchaeota archaeon]|nr:hypothetical protein [Nanoarchaeota archaeon]
MYVSNIVEMYQHTNSEVKEYVNFSKVENSLFLKSSLLLSVLYTLFAIRFTNINWLILIIPITIWTFILLRTHFLFHKYCAYKQGFQLQFQELYFDRFHLEPYETLTKRGFTKKPISYSILSFIIALLTIGFVVLNNLFTYTHKKIDHLFIGKRKVFEIGMGHVYVQENTAVRQSYAFFNSFLILIFYILLLSFLKMHHTIIFILLLITISYAFWYLFPLLPTLGYQYFNSNSFLWLSSVGMFFIVSIFGILLQNPQSILVLSLFTSLVFLVIMFVRYTNKVGQ